MRKSDTTGNIKDPKVPSLENLSHLSYDNETCYSHTLPTEDSKHIQEVQGLQAFAFLS